MSMFHFKTGTAYKFRFTNYRNEVETRHVLALGTSYGSKEYYSIPDWFLDTWDIERGEYRSFKLRQIDISTLVQA